MARALRWTSYFLLALALVTAATLAWQRYRLERASRQVEVVLDYAEALSLAQESGLSIRSVLERFRAAGVTGVGIGEYTLGQAVNKGQVFLYRGAELRSWEALAGARLYPTLAASLTQPGRIIARLLAQGQIHSDRTYLFFPRGRGPAGALAEALSVVLPSVGGRKKDLASGGFTEFVSTPRGKARPQEGGAALTQAAEEGSASAWELWEIPRAEEDVLELSLGLPPERVALARSLGLRVIGRLENPAPGATPAWLAFSLRRLGQAGRGSILLPGGEEVPGYPERQLLAQTGRELEKNHVLFAQTEFAQQKGEQAVAAQLGWRILRAHSIPVRELAVMSPATARERYLRAARERGIRLLYLHTLPGRRGRTALRENLAWVQGISESLTSAGFKLGGARLLPVWKSGLVPVLFLLAGLLGAFALFLAELGVSLPPELFFLLLAMMEAGASGLWLRGYTLPLREVGALGAALLLPTWGVLWAARRLERPQEDSEVEATKAGRTGDAGPSFWWFAGRGLRLFLGASAFSFLGGLLLVGFLSDWRYLLALASFRGVKLSFVIPLLAVAAVLLQGERGQGGERGNAWARWRTRVEAILGEPLRVWHFLALVALGVGGFYYLLRTGNAGVNLVLPGERALRGFLEKAFLYRPRTKEFLFGHPLLLLGLIWGGTRAGRRWRGLLITLGTIGQVSLLNTFSHIHSPLVGTLIRSAAGVVLGGLLGGLLGWTVWAAMCWERGRRRRENSEPEGELRV